MENFDSLIEQIEEREYKMRRRSMLYAIIPIIVAMFFIWYGVEKVNDANRDYEMLKGRNDTLKQLLLKFNEYHDLNKLNAIRDDINNLLRQENIDRVKILDAYNQYYSMDSAYRSLLNVALKINKNRDTLLIPSYENLVLKRQKSKNMLVVLSKLEDLNVKWHKGGSDPYVGLDGGGFVNYVTEKSGAQIAEKFYDPNQLEDGDIVDIEGSYSLFYFLIDGKPVYIGMNEEGVSPIKLDGIKVTQYRKVRFK